MIVKILYTKFTRCQLNDSGKYSLGFLFGPGN